MANTNLQELNHSDRLDALAATYRDGLLKDVIPFWLRCAPDHEHGGFMTIVDRDGTHIDTDKPVWFQGRFTWVLSELCNSVEKRDDWLAAAKLGIDFLRNKCFDTDGRMYFLLTREGKPLRKRRYVFSEMFAIVAYAAYAQAASDDQAATDAIKLFKQVHEWLATPGRLEPKVNPDVRPSKGIVFPMINLVTAQTLRQTVDDPYCDDVIEQSINEIRSDFLKPDYKALFECVAPDGSIIDHIDGRVLNPGHAIEAAWFILEEAAHRNNDRELIELGTTILDWMWQWGWDEQFGGILYFCDAMGKPAMEYWNDMKFWWPQNETIIATLMAYKLTGNLKYLQWHQMIHDWAYKYHPDTKHGEWFGYLSRDGRVTNPAKGTVWKGPFHLPRMQLKCWQLIEQIKRK